MLGQNCAGDGLSVSIYGSRKAVGLLGGSDQPGGTEEGEAAPSWPGFQKYPPQTQLQGYPEERSARACVCCGLGLGCGNG